MNSYLNDNLGRDCSLQDQKLLSGYTLLFNIFDRHYLSQFHLLGIQLIV